MAETKTKIVIEGVDKTKAAFDSASTGLNRIQGAASTLNGVLFRLAPLIGAATFTAFIKNSIDAADSLNDLSDRTGVAVETLAGLQLVANQSDTSLEALGKGLNKLSIFMAENAERAAELGLSAKDPAAAFVQLSKILTETETVGVRNSIANEVLGKSYQELLPALVQGSVALEDQIRRGKELFPITEKLADKAALLSDRLDEIQLTSKLAGLTIAEFLLPSLDEITKNFIKNTEKGNLFLAILASIGDIGKIAFFGTDEQQRIDRIQELSKFISFQSKQLQEASASSNSEVLDGVRTKISAAKKEMQDLIKLQSEPYNKLALPKGSGEDPEVKDNGSDKKTASQTIQEQIALIQQENNLMQQGVTLEDARTIAKLHQQGVGDELIVQTLNLQSISKQLQEEEKQRLADIEQLKKDQQIFNEGDIRAIDTEIELSDEQLDIEKQLEDQQTLAMDAYDKILEGIQKENDDLMFQLSIQGLSQQAQDEKIAARNVEIALQKTLNDLADQGLGLSEEEIIALRAKYAEIAKLGVKLNDNKSTSKDIAMTFNSALEDAIVSGKEFSDVLKGIEDDIVRILLRKTVTKPFTDAIDSIDFGSIFSDFFNAKGNAFNQYGVMPFAKGGVVNRATPFMFGSGGRLGVMGEAGPEAILPLRRSSNGQLGVQSDGLGGDTNVTVNIIGAASQPQVNQRNDGNGNMSIDVIFDTIKSALTKDVRSEGPFAQAMQSQYGLSRTPGAR